MRFGALFSQPKTNKQKQSTAFEVPWCRYTSSMSDEEETTLLREPFPPELVRKIVSTHTDIRVSPEALVAIGEVLRLFVSEAKERASVEAECDHEVSEEADESSKPIPIRADHVTKIAADLIFDFAT